MTSGHAMDVRGVDVLLRCTSATPFAIDRLLLKSPGLNALETDAQLCIGASADGDKTMRAGMNQTAATKLPLELD